MALPFSQRIRPFTETLVTSLAAGCSKVKSPLCVISSGVTLIRTSTAPLSSCVICARLRARPLSVSVPVTRTEPSLTVTTAAIAPGSAGTPLYKTPSVTAIASSAAAARTAVTLRLPRRRTFLR